MGSVAEIWSTELERTRQEGDAPAATAAAATESSSQVTRLKPKREEASSPSLLATTPGGIQVRASFCSDAALAMLMDCLCA
ncbi:hypothetical protein Nepgr_004567 [Nepenthes gracilis]|uniref:Uncharacterized protein n=1 Tax=Nepenthes gracilis TaxID=150966 RepID=A0AAD3XFB8_NEPGR|nr:hypothetical protein Nepgr_004567 [Nepenthes gracilis]